MDLEDELFKISKSFMEEKLLDKRCGLVEKALQIVKQMEPEKQPSDSTKRMLIDMTIAALESVSYKLITIAVDLAELISTKFFETGVSIQKLLSATAIKLGDSKIQVRNRTHECFKNIFRLFNEHSDVNIDMVLILLESTKNSRNWQLKYQVINVLVEQFPNIPKLNVALCIEYFVIYLQDASSQVRENSSKAIMKLYELKQSDVEKCFSKIAKLPATKLRQLLPQLSDKVLTPSKGKSSLGEVKNDKVLKTSKPQKSHDDGHLAISEEDLINCWETDIFTKALNFKDLEVEIKSIDLSIISLNNEWDDRTLKMRNIRGIVSKFTEDLGAEKLTQMLSCLKKGFMVSLKDLRSQVSKEICVTISYLAMKLGNDFSSMFEFLLPVLIQNFCSTIKIISLYTFCCTKLCIKHTICPKAVLIIIQHIQTSKSKDLRRMCFEVLNTLLEAWSANSWQNYTTSIEKVVFAGITDADFQARICARRIFWLLVVTMKPLSDAIFLKLDLSKQKIIMKEKPEELPEDIFILSEKQNFEKYSTKTFMRSRSNLSNLRNHNVLLVPIITDNNVESSKSPKVQKLAKPDLSALCESSVNKSSKNTNIQVVKSLEKLSNSKNSESCDKVLVPKNLKASHNVYVSRNTHSSDKINHSGKQEKDFLRLKTEALAAAVQNDIIMPETPRSKMILSMRGTDMTSNEPKSEEKASNSAVLGSPGNTPYAKRPFSSVDMLVQDTGNVSITHSNSTEHNLELIVILDKMEKYGTTTVSDLEKMNSTLSKRHLLKFSTIVQLESVFIKVLPSLNDKALIALFLNNILTFITNYSDSLEIWISKLYPVLFGCYSHHKDDDLAELILGIVETIRDTFPWEQQLEILFSYIASIVRINTKTKILVLQLVNILLIMSDEQFRVTNNKVFSMFVQKIITWAMDLISAELRKSSIDVIINISQMYPDQINRCISTISTNKQNFITSILRNNLNPGTISDFNSSSYYLKSKDLKNSAISCSNSELFDEPSDNKLGL